MKMRSVALAGIVVLGLSSAAFHVVGSRDVRSGWAPTDSATHRDAFASGGTSVSTSDGTSTRVRKALGVGGGKDDVMQLLASLSDADIPGVLAQFFIDDKGGEYWQLRSALAQRWAQRDPRAAMAFAESVRDDGKDKLIGDVMAVWAKKDVHAALRWAEGLPATRARTEALAALARTWAHQDPRAALAYFGDPARGSSPEVMSQLFEQWAIDDPRAAAIALMKDFPAGPIQELAMRAVLAEWAKKDPQEALAFAAGLTNPSLREDGTATALSEWASVDWKSVLAWSGTATGKTHDTAVLLALNASATEDPRGALNMLDRIPREDREGVERIAVNTLARSDPSGALKYARSLPRDARSEALVASTLAEWATRDPQSASQEIERLPPGPMRDQLVRIIAQNWSQHDLRSAIEWVKQIADPELQLTAVAVMLPQWVVADAKGMATFLVTSTRGSARLPLLRSVVSAWAKSDSQSALQWALQLPADPARDEAIAASVEAWARRDPAAAASFTLGLPAGPGRQLLLAEVGTEWAQQNMDAAMAWAHSLPDPDRTVVVGAITAAPMLPQPPPGEAH